jgi:hypothetical protein
MENVIRRDLWLNLIPDAGTHAKPRVLKPLLPTGMGYFDSDATLKYLLDHVEVVLTDYGRWSDCWARRGCEVYETLMRGIPRGSKLNGTFGRDGSLSLLILCGHPKLYAWLGTGHIFLIKVLMFGISAYV